MVSSNPLKYLVQYGLGIILLLVSCMAWANTPILILDQKTPHLIAAPYLEYLEDANHTLTIEQILAPNSKFTFTPNTKPLLSFGRSYSAQWVHLSFENQSNLKWYALIDTILGAEFSYYIFPSDSKPDFNTLNTTSGELAILVPNFYRKAWSFNLEKGQRYELYVRLTNGNVATAFPLEFYNVDAFLQKSKDFYTFVTFLYAGMMVLAIYQLFSFAILRDWASLAFCGLAFSVAITIHRTNPVFESLAFFSKTDSYFYSLPLFLILINLLIFSRLTLSLKKFYKKLDYVFQFLIIISILGVCVSGLFLNGNVIPIILMFFTLILVFITCVLMAFKGNKAAGYFAAIYLIPIAAHSPNFIILIFDVKLWAASRDLVAGIGTLVFLLFLSIIQAIKVRTLREEMNLVSTANKAKDEFLAVMSHELRTPMSAVVGLSTLLNLTNPDTKQQAYISKLDSAAKHMLQLINNLLDFAKLRHTGLVLKKEPFNLKLALNAIIPIIEQQAQQKGLQFSATMQGNLDIVVVGDRTYLAQILYNLLTNAIKYTQIGSVAFSVKEQGISSQKISLQFEVNDTGVGIDPEYLPHIFEPYFQTPKMRLTSEGVGLGLSISKRLVETMNGAIRVKSELNKGSRFTVTLALPLYSVPSEATTSLLYGEFYQQKQTIPAGLKILLVDDSEINRFVYGEMLKNIGIEVHLAPDGKQAVLALQQQVFDLVLLDLSMPEMNGIEVTHWIRRYGTNPHLPIVILTAHVIQAIEEECLAAGVNGFLTKPFEYDDLKRCIMHALFTPPSTPAVKLASTA